MKLLLVSITLFILNVGAQEGEEQKGKRFYKEAIEMAKLKNLYGPCDEQNGVANYTADIAMKLQEAAKLGQQIKSNKALEEAIGTTLAYRELVSRFKNPLNQRNVAKTLAGVTFWGQGGGVFGNISKRVFVSQNTGYSSEIVFSNESGEFSWQNTAFSYEVFESERDSITGIRFNYEDGMYTRFILNRNEANEYYLVPEDDAQTNPYMNGFVDYPSECEA